MRTLLRALVADWRLDLPVAVGMSAACAAWFLIANQTVANLVWILIVASGTLSGVIWHRRHQQ